MKFFRKYDLVLPPAALLYGISAWNMKYPGGWTATDDDG